MLGKKSTVIFRKGIGVMGKYGQGFAKIFLWTVIFVFLLSSTCFASKQEVLQFKAIVPVTGPETNATVSLERGSKVILDASEDAIAATYSWTYLGGSSAVTLLNRSLPTAYFWSDRPGVYQFSLQITQDDSISETRNVAVTVRDIHFVEITQPTEEERMRMVTKPFAHPMEWIALGAMGVYGTGTLTTDKPVVDIEGFTGLYTTTLECKNLTTGAQYTVSSNINHGDYRLAFSFDGVVLQEGDNLIEVTGIDDFGTQCRDARFITYNPGITYLTPLKLSPDYVSEGKDGNVEFSLQIRVKEGETLPEKFDLYESTVSGDLVQKIGELLPKGNPVQGFYSAMVNLPGVTGKKYYRAAVGQSQKSITAELGFLSSSLLVGFEHTSGVIAAIQQEILEEGMIGGRIRVTEMELNRRMETIAERLNERDDVKYVRIHSRGEVIRVKFATGPETGFSLCVVREDDEEPVSPKTVVFIVK